jgi:lipopolysaccharide transport system ATP-binding protein
MATPLLVEIDYWKLAPNTHLHVGLRVHTEQQLIAFTTTSTDTDPAAADPLTAGLFRSVCEIPGNLLNAGVHRITVFFVQDGHRTIYRHEEALSFDVLDLQIRAGTRYWKEIGVVRPKLSWNTQQLESL